MFQIIFKIFYFIVVFPFLIVMEGYKMLKKFIAKHGLSPDWAWTWLIILTILLIVLLLFQYGYR